MPGATTVDGHRVTEGPAGHPVRHLTGRLTPGRLRSGYAALLAGRHRITGVHRTDGPTGEPGP